MEYFRSLFLNEKYQLKEHKARTARAKELVESLPENLNFHDIDIVCSGGGFRGIYFGGVY